MKQPWLVVYADYIRRIRDPLRDLSYQQFSPRSTEALRTLDYTMLRWQLHDTIYNHVESL